MTSLFKFFGILSSLLYWAAALIPTDTYVGCPLQTCALLPGLFLFLFSPVLVVRDELASPGKILWM